jgi:hypothetical protein
VTRPCWGEGAGTSVGRVSDPTLLGAGQPCPPASWRKSRPTERAPVPLLVGSSARGGRIRQRRTCPPARITPAAGNALPCYSTVHIEGSKEILAEISRAPQQFPRQSARVRNSWASTPRRTRSPHPSRSVVHYALQERASRSTASALLRDRRVPIASHHTEPISHHQGG